MASKIPRELVPSDVNLANDPAILRAGFKAELLFRRANEYAKRMNRDGIIYPIELPIIAHGIPGNPRHLADTLINVGLWEDTEEGLVIRSFLKWNMSQEEQLEARRKRKIGALRTNHGRGLHSGQPDTDCPLCQKEGTA